MRAERTAQQFHSNTSQWERHIKRQGQNWPVTTDIVVTQFNSLLHMILFRMPQDGFCAFGIAGIGLDFYRHTFSVIANHKIYLQTAVLMEVIKLSAHFCKDVCNQIFKDCSLVSIEIAPQDVILCAIFQHTDKQTAVTHIDFEAIFFCIAVQGQLCNGEIAAAGNNTRILNPLQATGIPGSGGAFLDY